MTRLHVVKKSRKELKADDGTVIPVGSSYFWWKFRYGGIHRSLARPSPRQLTQNAFKQEMFDIEDQQAQLSADSPDDLRVGIEDLKNSIESMRDEAQDHLDNMPESLQENSDSGQLLTERIEALESMMDILDGIDVPEEPTTVEPVLPENATDEQKKAYEDAKAEYDEEKGQYENDLESALSEAQGVSYDGP